MLYSTHLDSEIEELISTGGRLRTSARVVYHRLRGSIRLYQGNLEDENNLESARRLGLCERS